MCSKFSFLVCVLLITNILVGKAQQTKPSLFILNNSSGLNKSDLIRSLEADFLETCDEIAELDPLPRQQIGKRLLDVSRTYLKRISYLAYAYQLTGNEKYLLATEKNLLAAADFTDWNPSHFLDVAEMTMAMGVGYDWVKDDLSAASAKKIREAIVEKGLRPAEDEKSNNWLNVTNNWNQVCNASIAVGAWAVEEHYPELSSYLIDRAKDKIRIPEAQYGPDGVYPEGTSYWEYGTSFNVLFVDAYEKKYPNKLLETSEGFKKTGKFFLHAHGPTGSFNYSDSRQNEVVSAALFWFASKSKDPSLLYNQLPLVEKIVTGEKTINAANQSDRFYAFLLIWLAELEDISSKKPEELTWSGKGENPVSFQRTGWEREAIYLGVKAGSPSLSHGHMDVGSFVLDASGIRWAIDLGMSNYNALEIAGVNIWDNSLGGDRWKVFRYNNLSHNTLVVDSAFQDLNAAAVILEVIDTKVLKSTKIDLTSAYKKGLKSAIRTTAISDEKEVVITDVIQNNSEASSVRWAMMTYDDIEILGNGKAIISQGGKRLNFEVVSPINVKLKIYPVLPTMSGEEGNEGLAMIGFETEFKAGETQSLVVKMKVEE